MKSLSAIHPFFFVLAATVLEASGDALLRKCLYEYTGGARLAFFALGAALLFGYGCLLNLAPVPFGQVVGLYIALLFLCFQVVNYIAFGALPTMPVAVGGLLVVTGGLLITFWKP